MIYKYLKKVKINKCGKASAYRVKVFMEAASEADKLRIKSNVESAKELSKTARQTVYTKYLCRPL